MDQVLLSNTEVSKQNGVLRLFIGLVQLDSSCISIKECSEKDCATVLNWLSSNQLDMNKKDWYRNKDGKEIPQLQRNLFENKFLYWILELKDMLSFLLKSNGNIQFVDERGKTILHVFLEDYLSGYDLQNPSFINCELIKLLMDKGVSVQIADQNGNTPLHVAAKLRAISLVEIMLENYLNVNACNNQGDTLLHILCSEISHDSDLIKECAQSLLSKGANLNLQNKMGWTPAHFAAKCGYLYVLKIFLRSGATFNMLTNNHESLLLLACKYALLSYFRSRSSELVKLLINSGCNVNETDQEGCSPLHYACNSYRLVLACKRDDVGLDWTSSFTDTSVLKPLVEAGVDVNAETADGTTPLLLVASSWLSDAVKYLHEEGADISRRENIFGFTALHMAALGNYESNLKYLLEQGLDVDDSGIYGITALHLASFRNNVQFMKLLIDRGADVHRRDDVYRSTALHFLAKEGRILDYISLICDVKRKPFWNTRPFAGNLSISDRNPVALIVNCGVDVNAKDVYGRTPLHLATTYAAEKEYLCEEVGQQCEHPIIGLLKCGASVDVQDDEGNLPLHNALKTGHTKALDYLLKFGVDVNEADTSSIVLSCKNEDLKSQVFRYLMKLRAAELPVSEAYSLHMNHLKFQSFYDDCLREVEQMKSFVIADNTSLYDLLHIGWRRRANFAQKIPADLQKKFPAYARIIQATCREAEQRKCLLEPAKLGWYRITEVNLPDVCVDRILVHLKNRYLRVLAEGLFEDDA